MGDGGGRAMVGPEDPGGLFPSSNLDNFRIP